ncbi:MAG: hypothetical protein QM758_29120 [Armatimonas sp.]
MEKFVLLFRQQAPLSEADLKNRAKETRPWALKQNAAGHKLEPRILGKESAYIGANKPAETVTALLFLEARDLKEAIAIAQTHPGVRYGATVEVRPWDVPNVPS